MTSSARGGCARYLRRKRRLSLIESIKPLRTVPLKSAPKLSAAAQTDTALQAHTATAATLTQAGARRLDAIAAETRATSQAAATVRTPAGERAILVALRSQLARANDVVTTTKQQAAGLAGQVRALKYPPAGTGHGDTQALGFGLGSAPQAPPPEDPPHG